MYKTIKKYLLIFLMILLFGMVNVCAIDCEYSDIGLTITYNHNAEPADLYRINFKKFGTNQGYHNFLIFKYGQMSYGADELKVTEELFKRYQGKGCPSEMYVCEYYHSSLNLPSITSLGYTIQNIFTGAYNEQAYALFTVNEKKLYIFDQKDYENSGLDRYFGGFLSDSIDESGLDAYEETKEWCGDGAGCEVLAVGGYIFSGLWSIVDDTVFGDGVEFIYLKEAACTLTTYNGPYIPLNINCPQLVLDIYGYRDLIYEYTSCGDTASCKSDVINRVKELESNIKSYCSNILQNYDYKGGQLKCIDDCLSIKETLDSLKEGTDLQDNITNLGECGFSSRLLVWVSNILRWVKYILPVIVVVFGIIDFIKAISDEKEDEMKKAQKRFVTRLIAAALVFIIPLIIEFVLDKMGFGYNSCGLF